MDQIFYEMHHIPLVLPAAALPPIASTGGERSC